MNEHVKSEVMKPMEGGAPARVAERAVAQGGTRRTPRQRRQRSLFMLSFVCVVILPTLLAGAYFLLVAADQYAVEVRFAVRGPEGNSSTDLLSLATGTSSSNSTTTDAYILMDYLKSRQLLEDLSKRVDFEAIFNPSEADLLMAFPVNQRPIEKFVEHWRDMVRIDFDTTSNIIIVELRTFKPADSLKIAQETLKLSEQLINRLSERSRQDALRGANEEVARQEERLRKGLASMRRFREKSQDIDPSQSAAAQLARLSELEGKLNAEKTTLATQRTFMSDNSPAIQFTRSKIKALEKQVAAERSKLGQGAKVGEFAKLPQGTLSSRVQDYQALTTELEFAQKAYLQSLLSLEQARLTANKQQRYLATFVAPSLPQYALYPLRWTNSLISLLLCFGVWVIGWLIIYGVRDHAM